MSRRTASSQKDSTEVITKPHVAKSSARNVEVTKKPVKDSEVSKKST